MTNTHHITHPGGDIFGYALADCSCGWQGTDLGAPYHLATINKEYHVLDIHTSQIVHITDSEEKASQVAHNIGGIVVFTSDD